MNVDIPSENILIKKHCGQPTDCQSETAEDGMYGLLKMLLCKLTILWNLSMYIKIKEKPGKV